MIKTDAFFFYLLYIFRITGLFIKLKKDCSILEQGKSQNRTIILEKQVNTVSPPHPRSPVIGCSVHYGLLNYDYSHRYDN